MDMVAQIRSIQERVADLQTAVGRIEEGLAYLFSSKQRPDEEELAERVRGAIAQAVSIRADTADILAATGGAQEWADRAALAALLESAQAAIVSQRAPAAAAQLRRLSDQLEGGLVRH